MTLASAGRPLGELRIFIEFHHLVFISQTAIGGGGSQSTVGGMEEQFDTSRWLPCTGRSGGAARWRWAAVRNLALGTTPRASRRSDSSLLVSSGYREVRPSGAPQRRAPTYYLHSCHCRRGLPPGSYGNEALVLAAPPGTLFFSLIVLGLAYGVPLALITAELGTGWPVAGGMAQWVEIACGERLGAHNAWWIWVRSSLAS